MDVSAVGMTDPAGLIFTAAALAGLSGRPGLLLRHTVGLGQKIATLALTLSGLLGLSGALTLIIHERTETFTINWTLPFGPCEMAIDPLSALFLLPIFLISACGAVFAVGYWPATHNRATEPKLTFFFGLLSASMALLVTTRNGVLFLMVWEVMALSAYFTLIAEHENREVRKAGIVYLVATHTGTLALFVMFALLRGTTHSFQFPASNSLPAAAFPAAVIFVTALFGFGVKAGLMPFHIWLPAAHANAPSHISAVMSGVMLKMGIYGIIRIISFYHTPPLWWGILLLAAGSVSALLGIIFAITQRDIKRLLACSSIENIGIITIGVGVAVIGQATHNPTLLVLGMAGALLHMLNHSLFKPLLFLGAGTLIHATGTRQIDRMGGLARPMPVTSLFFLTGIVAICGLPPLNGFVSEFLLYLGFFSEARTAAVPYLAMGAPLLALIGGLAVICFVKLYGVAFLGLPRTAEAEKGHEPGWQMLAPMGVLALLCVSAGLLPQVMVNLLRPALFTWAPELAGKYDVIAAVPPLRWLTIAGGGVLLLAGALSVVLRKRLRSAPVAGGGTWGCGYLRPASSMQYTASSFGDTAVNLFGGVIRPRCANPVLPGYFPRPEVFASNVSETLLEQMILPLFRVTGEVFSFLRRLQLGKVHIYMLYIFVTLVLLLIWAY